MGNNLLRRFAAVTAAALCLTAALSGCGDNSDTEEKSPASKAADKTDSTASEKEAAEVFKDEVYTENITGTADGYDYELWKDSGNTTMTVSSGGTFSCEWSDINNALFRRGKKFDCTKTYKELGNISIKYGVDYQPDGNSYMCVYGWTRDPLIEYYIVETWGSWRPPGAPFSLGTVTVDGAVYDIYKTTRYEQPSIDGTKTFDQYWSVRQTKPTADGTKIEGTISVSKHFDAWEKVGLELGKMYEVALNIEGYQSKGQATIYENELTIDGNYTEDTSIEVTKNEGADAGGAPQAMTGGAGFFTSNFEEDECSWMPRGSATVKQTTDEASDGNGSLFVSGRSDNWNGCAIMLDGEVFKAGGTYHFKTDAMQKSGSDVTLKFTMQYTDAGGDHYEEVDQKSAPDGEWITLEGDYTVPEGAVNAQLYVESPDSLTDFYIDCASGTGEGGETVESSSGKEDESVYEFKDPVAIKNTADISWIDKDRPMVAIAFDDGASATNKTDPAYRIIDTMADNGFHATFFYVGNWIKTEEQVKYAHEKGMEIANHTMTHPYLSKLSAQEIRDEYEKCREKLKGIIGEEPSAVMRLPYLDGGGDTTKTLNDVALISCAVDTKDWNKATKEDIVNTIVKAKENGSLNGAIVLCHENYAATADAMAEIVPALKAEGWQVVTVSELFAANGKELTGGKVYSKLS